MIQGGCVCGVDASTTSWGTPTGMRVYVPHGPCLSGSKRGQAKDGGIRSVPSNCRGSSSIAGTIWCLIRLLGKSECRPAGNIPLGQCSKCEVCVSVGGVRRGWWEPAEHVPRGRTGGVTLLAIAQLQGPPITAQGEWRDCTPPRGPSPTSWGEGICSVGNG